MRTQSKYASKLFRAAGSDIRTTILTILFSGPQDTGTIRKKLKRSPSLIAHHLKVLHSAGWVTKSKFGKLVTYYIHDKAVREILVFLKKAS
ncbi:hypothetical protein A2363_01210 [Candidatus Gottesmanbacteria bacterium RIFOXYB1_FULL_47_11]|uniref:HTH arsR-type domain-containing protein n=1 Tax=Candidatus Gottesmanbacteria bacterium RIFOXYB1_FULL_47_11 TaxID=1798401 RepID=A0A1F6BEZ8_9BACT|nr:MAG: hypothetical protein A2363_01210 [Candidatus Gottesmanbacteria bacterium RIFOXYB1_FULL_47_11]